MNFVPADLYKEFLDKMPLLTVDVVIIKDGKYLLIRRDNNPSKGEMWIPGGRMLKDETIKDSAIRKAKEEVGLECEFDKIINIMEYFEPTSIFEGVSSHTVGPVVAMRYISGEVNLDKDHSEYEWREKIMPDSPEILKEQLRKAGFSE